MLRHCTFYIYILYIQFVCALYSYFFLDFDLLLENVLEELSTCYLSAICSKESSIFLERILEFADESFSIKFSLDFVGRSWVSVITSPYAARVFEASLKVLGRSNIGMLSFYFFTGTIYGQPPYFIFILSIFSLHILHYSYDIQHCLYNTLKPQTFQVDFDFDFYAFVLPLTNLLTPYLEPERIEELIQWFIREADWSLLVESPYASQSIKHMLDCINQYPTIVKQKISLRHDILQKINLDNAVMTTHGSSLIQFLLYDSYHKDGVDHEVLPPKGSDPIMRIVKHSQDWEDGKGSVDFQIVFTFITANSDRFETFIRHQGASHLIEVLLFMAPRTFFTDIWQKHFRTKLDAKNKHPVANFVVQKLIECARNEGQFRLIYDELKDSIPELLQGRTGVLVKLFQGALKFADSQKEILKLLISSLSKSTDQDDLQETRKNIASILILLKNTPRNVFKKKKERKQSKFSALGCQLLTEIFKFDASLNAFIVTSFIGLEDGILEELCLDRAGSHVVESFFTSPAISAKLKQTAINKLIKANAIVKLAQDKSGSYVLEKCFNAAEIKAKEKMIKQLVEIEEQLSLLPQGRFVLKFCKVDMYKQKRDNWVKTEESNTKKADMLNELLDEFNKETTKMKKRKRKEESEGEDKKKDKKKKKKKE